MKPVILAAGSALCALACIVQVLASLILVFFYWQLSLLVLPLGILAGVLAKSLDREKLRTIHGSRQGDALARSDLSHMSCTELARQDVEALVGSRKSSQNLNTTATPTGSENGKVVSAGRRTT